MKKLSTILVLSLTLFLSFVAPTKVQAEVEEIDLTGIDLLAQGRVDSETIAGGTVFVKKGDHILYHKSYGYAHKYDRTSEVDETRALLENPRMMENDTLYDLASVTKVMATTQAMMMLVSQGLVDLDEPVATYMPEFGQNGKETVTSRDLLTHTSGLAQWKPTFLYTNTREGEKEIIMSQGLDLGKGNYYYSDLGFMSLAFLIEAVTGQPVEVYLHENLYGPLGLTDTMYVPLENGVSKERIAATSLGNPYEWRMSNQRDYNVGYNTSVDQEAFDAFEGWRHYTLIGEVNDGNAGMANEGIAGHAGLFSTTSDLSVFGDLMLNGGTLNGIEFYDEATFNEFTSAQEGLPTRGLGFYVASNASATSGYVGQYGSEQTFGHDGFTGTQVIFDKTYDLQIIILTNKQNVGPYNANASYYSTYSMSREISTLVYETVIDAIENASKDILQEVYDETLLLDLTLFTPTSASALSATLTSAYEVLVDEYAIQTEIDTALLDLNNAIQALVPLGDKTILESLIGLAENLDLTNMTEASVAALQTALLSAKEVLAEENVDQSTIDEAVVTLEAAIDGLFEVETEEPIDNPEDVDEEQVPEETDDATLPATGSTAIFAYTGIGTILMGLVLLLKNKFELFY